MILPSPGCAAPRVIEFYHARQLEETTDRGLDFQGDQVEGFKGRVADRNGMGSLVSGERSEVSRAVTM